MKNVIKIIVLFFTVVMIFSCHQDFEVPVEEYNLLYHGNSHTSGDPPIERRSFPSGEEVIVLKKNSTLLKDGYKFKYWNTKEDNSGKIIYPGFKMMFDKSDLHLYAIWELCTHKVIYKGDAYISGDLPVDNTMYLHGDTFITAAPGTMTRKGDTFKNWNTKLDGSGISYETNTVLTIVSSDITLYAQWTPIYKTGDIGPASGYIFYDFGNYSKGFRYLEASPSDVCSSAGVQWSNGTHLLINSTNSYVGYGEINTQKIINIQGNGSYAAKICMDYSVNGYDDWFLPSWYELLFIKARLSNTGLVNFREDFYWASTEFAGGTAAGVFFHPDSGTMMINKSSTLQVRAVRSF